VTFQLLDDGAVIVTVLAGRVTDDEVAAYYQRPEFVESRALWIEVVDGRGVTDLAITPVGLRALARFMAANLDRLRGGKVAMVAASDATYGTFRMWELQREALPYDVSVFRDFEEAVKWVRDRPS
jgi:hypothetical protein